MSTDVVKIKPRRPRLSRAMRRVVELMASGKAGTQIAAATATGLSPEHISRMLRRQEVQNYLTQRTHEILSQGKIRAAQRLINLVDSSSEHVSESASRAVLAIAGIKPAETPLAMVNLNVTPGYIVDLGVTTPSAPIIEADVSSE